MDYHWDDVKMALGPENTTCSNIPCPHDVIEAIAEDFRKLKSLENDSRVAIVVVVDEQHMYYDAHDGTERCTR